MTRIFLTRHGQTEWNVAKRMQGQKDSPLTPLGVKQGTALGKYLQDYDINAIYCSSSHRAVHTAELIRGKRDIDINPCDDLREICVGDWEGKSLEEAEAYNPVQFENFWHKPEDFVPDNGETFVQLRDRAATTIREIVKRHPNQTVLVVSHGIVLKTLYTFFMNQSIADIVNTQHPQSTCLCEVVFEDSICKVLDWNRIDHYKFIEE